MWVRVVHHKPKGEEVQFETVDTLNDLNSMFYNRVISNWKIDSKKRLQDALRNWILFRLKPDQLCPSHFQLKLDTQVTRKPCYHGMLKQSQKYYNRTKLTLFCYTAKNVVLYHFKHQT